MGTFLSIVLFALVFYAFQDTISELWRSIEIWLYGYSQVSIVDTVICIIISILLTFGLAIAIALFYDNNENEE